MTARWVDYVGASPLGLPRCVECALAYDRCNCTTFYVRRFVGPRPPRTLVELTSFNNRPAVTL